MNASNEQNSAKKPLTIIGIVLLTVVVILGIAAMLLKFKLDNTLQICAAPMPLFVFLIALVVFQKRASMYSILALIISFLGSLLLIASSIAAGYSDALSMPTKAFLNQVHIGLLDMGLGLTFITFAITTSGFNKPGVVLKAGFSMILFLICGVILFGIGIYTFVTGLQYLTST